MDLVDAAGHGGSPAAVRAALARGDDPNAVRYGDSALGFACMYDHRESVQLLLDAGADVRFRGAYGRTPLHYARSAEIVHLLVDRGADLAARNDGDQDALYDGITHGGTAATTIALLERGLVVTRYFARAPRGETPPAKSHLAWAAFCRRADIVAVLLGRGGSPDETDDEGQPVLVSAIGRDPPAGNEIARLLLEAGANPNVVDRWGTSLLARLASRRDAALLALALQRGAQLREARSPIDSSSTVLHVAARAGDPDVLFVLIEHDAATIDATDSALVTPLMAAAASDRLAAVELLLRCGADPARRDREGNTLLHHAARAFDPAVFERLVAAGCDPEEPNAAGWLPLHRACEGNRLQLVRYLLDRGAAIDARTHDQRTPLMLASAGATHVADLLRERGADPALRDEHGRTAADFAAAHAEAVRRELEARET